MPNLLMHMIQDGIITGAVERTKKHCGNCNTGCMCISITKIDLPEGITPSSRIIAYGQEIMSTEIKPHRYLGLGCGCYAKFHRQLAHIGHNMAEHAVRSL